MNPLNSTAVAKDSKATGPKAADATSNTNGSTVQAAANATKSKLRENLSSIIPLLFVFGFFSVGVVAGYFAYTEYLRIPELKLQIEAKKQELSKVTAYANYLQNLQSLGEKLDNNIKLSEQGITLKHEIPQLMNQMIQIANQTQVELISLIFAGSTTESTGTKTPGTVNIQVNVKGNFSQMLSFLQLIENARRQNTIKGFKYTSSGKTGGTTTSNASVSVNSFIQNSKLNENPYDMNITLSGYYLGQVNTKNIDYEIVSRKQSLDSVIGKLESMKWYEATALDLKVGTSDPFSININDLNLNKATTNPIKISSSANESGFAP